VLPQSTPSGNGSSNALANAKGGAPNTGCRTGWSGKTHVAVDDAEQRGDGGLVRGDAVQVAHTLDKERTRRARQPPRASTELNGLNMHLR
jgi:hypothetical protein